MISSRLLLADPKTFSGNRDKNTENEHFLSTPFVARFVRFHPIEFNNHISMRVGVYGCPYRGPCGPGFVRVQEDTPCGKLKGIAVGFRLV